ncbi:hypothetical protein [Thermococcus henrietii]|uniref:hypothetical protein n=1 Tax=Thermococcus henrietii TaxID=2016361 RepID=UPI000C078FBD|nr:hypothetical protein [Thermococcus henrietii]
MKKRNLSEALVRISAVIALEAATCHLVGAVEAFKLTILGVAFGLFLLWMDMKGPVPFTI